MNKLNIEWLSLITIPKFAGFTAYSEISGDFDSNNYGLTKF